LEKNWIGSNGPFNLRAETLLSEFFDQECLTVANGSVAIILALRALGIGPGDEVLVPDLTYAATASSVINVGAKPVLCDVNLDDWAISIGSMTAAITPKTKAVIVVHLYGQPADMRAQKEFCQQNNLYLIEDCAETFGGIYDGSKVGTFGDISTFSFFANKLITSGEGGAVTSANPVLISKMHLLRGQGMDPERRYYFLEAGYNFRMTNLQAAILSGQIERFTEIHQQRTHVENLYNELLAENSTRIINFPNRTSAPWLYTTTLKNISEPMRYQIAQQLALKGIETRPIFWPLSLMPAFSKYKQRHENTTALSISQSGITLPTGVQVDDEDIRLISRTINDYMGRNLV
jgi:perosamine synthetase